MKRFSTLARVMACLALIAAVGCQGSDEKKEDQASKSKYDGAKFVLSAEPDGGQHVKAALESVKNEDDIVIVGRIGGSTDPWIKNRAAFSIVDPAVQACSDETADGETCGCPTPWDYCCKTNELSGAMALVKFVDADGKVVQHDAREVFDLKELQTVVVQGKAERDEAGNLTILAKGMYVRK